MPVVTVILVSPPVLTPPTKFVLLISVKVMKLFNVVFFINKIERKKNHRRKSRKGFFFICLFAVLYIFKAFFISLKNKIFPTISLSNYEIELCNAKKSEVMNY